MMKYQAGGGGSEREASAESGRDRLAELMTELLASVHGGDCPPYTCAKTGGCQPGGGTVQD
jgi:hypothetical protein